MNRFVLLSYYRSLARHKAHALINIGGMAIGIAVFLVLGLYVRFETSYETWLPRHERIHVVRTIWNIEGSPFNGPSGQTMGGLLDQLKEDFPALVGTRIRGGEGGGSILQNGTATREDVAQVDPSFFHVFDLPMVRGNGLAGLSDPAYALISESAARKYFGSSDPIGQSMTITMDRPATYRVAGIFRDLPRNSELRISVLTRLPSVPPQDNWFHWGSSSLVTYLRFDTPELAQALQQKLPSFVDRRARRDMGETPSKTISLSLLPIADAHLSPGVGDGAKLTVITLGMVGVLTLSIAAINYVNLGTARAALRAREVAMRKVLGADHATLVRQFLGESIVTVALAALIGLILAELGLPLINAAGGLSLAIPYAVVIPALALLVLLIGTAAGFYPAAILARFPAAAVLASARAPGGGRAGTRMRELLVIFQFGLAIAFMIGTAVLVAQTRHVRQADIGFQREGLLVIRSLRDRQIDEARTRAIVSQIRTLPGMTGVGIANGAAGGSGSTSSDNVPVPGDPGPGPSLRWIDTGPGFFEVHGVRPIAGRLFSDAYRTDDKSKRAPNETHNIIINERAVHALGFRSPQDAVGKTVGGNRPRTIIGVVPDLRFFSPRTPLAPTYYFYTTAMPFDGAVASVRFVGDSRALLAKIRAVWQTMAPEVPFVADTADRRLAQFYEADDRATRLFAMGAALAVLIGCVGLWGLASFTASRREKEVGIRKTLGASSTDIVKLLIGQFVRPVLLANVIAWPLAFVAMRAWLAGFDDRISLSPLFFLGASALATAIAVFTALGHALRASRTAPASALRHD